MCSQVKRTLSAVVLFSVLLPCFAWAQQGTSTGVVKVTTKPSGATVYVNKRSYGPTPVLIELPAGKNELMITCPGFVPFSKKVVVQKGMLLRTRIVLLATVGGGIKVHHPGKKEYQFGPGSVTIITEPPGLTVFMNDMMVPQPTPVVFDIRSGVYEMTIEQSGDIVFRKTVVVRAAQAVNLDLAIKKKRRIDDSDPWK